MSDGDIYSDNSMYGGFRGMMYNLLRHQDNARARHWEEECTTSTRRAVAAANAAPTHVDETVAVARAPGAKKSPPVAVAEHTYLTKRPTSARRGLRSPLLRLCPLLRLHPLLLLPSTGLGHAHLRRRSPPPILPPTPAAASVPFPLVKPIHPSGILFEIVGTTMSCQGRLYLVRRSLPR